MGDQSGDAVAPSVSSGPKPASPASVELGRRVRARREELGLSLEALSELSVLHWTYIGRVERGMPNPTLHSILRIADVLQLDAGELITGLQAPRPEDA
ncbi:helix-turn-helix transcriptional regulator [Nocardioides sp. C4-1]|uniref:helix-turn-helix domain-containing protein n=1 Tax=Nocardioides sp. C4-1 TaxID=3151851 RepID=UPI003262F40E